MGPRADLATMRDRGFITDADFARLNSPFDGTEHLVFMDAGGTGAKFEIDGKPWEESEYAARLQAFAALVHPTRHDIRTLCVLLFSEVGRSRLNLPLTDPIHATVLDVLHWVWDGFGHLSPEAWPDVVPMHTHKLPAPFTNIYKGDPGNYWVFEEADPRELLHEAVDDFVQMVGLNERYRKIWRRHLARCEERHLTPGDVLVQEGTNGRELFLMVDGTLEAVINTPAGERQVARFLPGEFCGEMALLTGAARNATLRALSFVRILVIPAELYAALLAVEPVATNMRRMWQYRMLIGSSPFFRSLGLSVQRMLARDAELVEVAPGQLVFANGSHDNHLYQLVDGLVTIEVDGTKVGEVRESGTVLGERAAILNLPRNADGRANGVVHVLSWHRDTVTTALNSALVARHHCQMLADERGGYEQLPDA